MKNWSYFALAALFLIFSGCKKTDNQLDGKISPAKEVVNPEIVRLVQDLYLDDIISGATGGDAIMSKDHALHYLNITTSVDAPTLAKSYDSNEVAADQKYKVEKAYILVSGKVNSINKDIMGDPYLALRGHAMFQDVQAHFEKAEIDVLAALRKGQEASFVCRVAGRIVSQVMLRECTTITEHANNEGVRKPLDQYISDVIYMKIKARSEKDVEFIPPFFVAGEKLPKDSPCFNGNPNNDKCALQLNGLLKSLSQEDKAKISRLAHEMAPAPK